MLSQPVFEGKDHSNAPGGRGLQSSCAPVDGESTMSLRSRMRSLVFAVSVAAPMLTLPVTQAHAGVFISVNFGPPALPVYAQPPLPAPGYHLDPRLLGLWRRRLLLGSRRLGAAAQSRRSVDPRLLGICRRLRTDGTPATGARTSASTAALTTASATAASASSAASGAAESSPTTAPWPTSAAST